jgi:hypothetical protein
MAERWHIPPWEIGKAKLGDNPILWYRRQIAWDNAKHKRAMNG